MGKLQELIQKHCPDGVEYKALGELLDYEQPGKYIVKSTDYDDSYAIPVLTAGKGLLLGYTDETEGVFDASSEHPVIIFDDFTTSRHMIDCPFKVKSSAMKMLRLKQKVKCDFRFVFYAMSCIEYEPQTHTRQWIGTYSLFTIPIPPIEVQREIVRLLDAYTAAHDALVAKLNEEIRLVQYRTTTILDDVLHVERSRVVTLPEVSRNLDGVRKPVAKSSREPGPYPYYGASGIVDYVSEHLFDGEYLLIAEDGANLVARSTPIAFVAKGKTWVNNHAHVLEFDDKNIQRFVELYLNATDISMYVTGAAQPKLNQKNLNRIEIPLPNDEELESIITHLSDIQRSHEELKGELEKEVGLHEAQLAEFCNQILSFPEKVA